MGRILEYNKRAPKSDMRHIDYGLGAISAEVLKDENAAGPFDLADIYHRLSLRDNSRDMKFTSGFTRSAHTRGSPRRRTISKGRTN